MGLFTHTRGHKLCRILTTLTLPMAPDSCIWLVFNRSGASELEFELHHVKAYASVNKGVMLSHQEVGGVRKRHSTHRRRKSRIVSVVGICALIAVGVWLLKITLSSRYSPADDLSWLSGDWDRDPQTDSALQAFASAQRTVYPYSIVPGGIQTGEELRRVVEHDPVVASHFAGFDFRHAHVIELTEPKLFYLSYRMGNRVFWMHKQISLRTGEKLITDGSITARTRCANQVSVLPHAEVSPAEPQVAQLEQPVPAPIAFPNFVPAAYPEMPPVATPGPPTPAGGPVPIAILPPIGNPPTCVPPKNGKPVPGKPKPCPPPPTPPGVPEPTTILLFSSGVAGIYLRLRKR